MTPIIFARYRQANADGKRELSKNIRELKRNFFLNIPIKDILKGDDKNILTEMVYMAYQPIGMSFSQVTDLLKKIEDRTEDLQGYIFPLGGYDFKSEAEKKHFVKKGERLDFSALRFYQEALAQSYPDTEDAVGCYSIILKQITQGGFNLKQEELSRILSLINRDDMVVRFVTRYDPTVALENSYHYLAELKEIMSVYIKDNFEKRLINFLSVHPNSLKPLVKILSDPQRKEMLRRNLAKINADQNIRWDRVPDDYDEIGRVLSRLITHKILQPTRKLIADNLAKFETESGEKATMPISGRFKAYISKNAGSFFAKASAGICTASDIPLFQKPNHFHINIVQNEEKVKANNQAYIINDDGKKSLVLRGFNPRTDFISQIDAESYCESVIRIGRQFLKDNNMYKLYITDQGAWDALSNRAETCGRYLIQRYFKEKNKKQYNLQVSSDHFVSMLYEV